MKSKFKQYILLTSIALSTLFSPFSMAQTDDDDILDFIPAIIAGTNSVTPPTENPIITNAKKLAGTWRFALNSSEGTLVDYIRLDASTATLDGQVAVITGIGSYFTDFFSPNPAAGGFDNAQNIYLAVNYWGDNLASYYFFASPSSNNASADCHFYGDFDGNIPAFATCSSFTKSKISNVQKSLVAKSAQSSDVKQEQNNKRYELYEMQQNAAYNKNISTQQPNMAVYRDIIKQVVQQLKNESNKTN